MTGKDDDPKGLDALQEMNSRLGGLLGALNEALGQAVTSIEAGKGIDQSWDSGEGKIRTTGHLRVRSALDAIREREGRQGRDPAEPIRTAPVKPNQELRQVPHEMFEEPEAWIATAELPGVGAGDISLGADAGRIVLTTTGARKYRVAIDVPEVIDPARAEITLTNGILELRLPKAAKDPSDGSAETKS